MLAIFDQFDVRNDTWDGAYRTGCHMPGLHSLELGHLLGIHAMHHIVTTHGHTSGQVITHLLCLGHHRLLLSLGLDGLQSLLLHVLGRDCRSTLATICILHKKYSIQGR